jgi:hypothetical protein
MATGGGSNDVWEGEILSAATVVRPARLLMLPGKIIGKSWYLRFWALPGELTFISQRRAGEADRDPV